MNETQCSPRIPGTGTVYGKITVSTDATGTSILSDIHALCYPRKSMPVNVSTQVIPQHPLQLSTIFELTFRPCKAGEWLDNQICLPCPEGTYSLQQDPQNWAETKCFPCPDNAVCKEGSIIVKEGYWRSHYLSPQPIQCLYVASCGGGTIENGNETDSQAFVSDANNIWASTNVQCTEGNVGPLCGACAPGWFRGGVTCHQCDKAGDLTLSFTIIIPLILLAITIYVLYRLSPTVNESTSIVTTSASSVGQPNQIMGDDRNFNVSTSVSSGLKSVRNIFFYDPDSTL